MLPMSFFGYASFAFILTLWGNEYLEIIHSLENIKISSILMYMALSWTLGSFFYGILIKKIDKKKNIILISTIIIIFLLIILILISYQNFYILLLLFCLFGFVGAYTLVVIAQYRSLFRSEIIGKVLTTANFFNFLGVFYVQWSTGIIKHFSENKFSLSNNISFDLSFIAVIFYLIVSIFCYLKIDEKSKNE